MAYFLERIAQLLHEETGGNLIRHCLVFPNRRAGIYFLKYLSGLIDKPVWAPSILTINEFFTSFSELSIADSEILLLELYKVYRKLNISAGSFDEFYFWGDMLLSDFDDIDKYLAPPAVVFRNVSDFRTIDSQFGDLDEHQAEIIKRFWKNFDPQKPSPQKSDFKSIWSLLYDLYSDFNSSLRAQNIAYEGMIFREVVGNRSLNASALKWTTIHFIGFNALNTCEKELMLQIKNKGIAKFYWDFDNSYVNEAKQNSAGLFLSGNLRIFGNDMPDDWSYDTLLSFPVKGAVRRVYETTTDISQVKLLPGLINQLPRLSLHNAHHIAVILADENLLVPALSSLPENIESVNITMGCPLRMTGVYGFIKCILNLQRNRIIENNTIYFDFQDVKNILHHKLAEILFDKEDFDKIDAIFRINQVRIRSDMLTGSGRLYLLFTTPANASEFSAYLRNILLSVSNTNSNTDTSDQSMLRKLEKEFIYRVILAVNRLEAIVKTPELSFRSETYIRILDKILRNLSVPFTGEPLAGIQIMGILETRALDFSNIIMLSVNEGILPSSGSVSSFIPFSIREAFGLPVINHQESVYAYHFYRLLHRAENVTFVYNSGSDGLKTGEMSRFLTQMQYEHAGRPEISNLSFEIRSPASVSEEITRTELHQSALISTYFNNDSSGKLSPTIINLWLNCRMKFYYRYVNVLKEPIKFPSEIDYAAFGSILHSAMKEIYFPFKGREVTNSLLQSVIGKRSSLQSLIEHAVNKVLGKEQNLSVSGNELIIRDVLGIFLLRILEADKLLAPFRIIALEESFEFNLPVNVDCQSVTARTGGNVDRIDLLQGTTRLVDYKTGKITHKIGGINDLFEDDRRKELDGWLQTLLYCEAYLEKNPLAVVRPSLYVVREITTGALSDTLNISTGRNSEDLLYDYSMVRPEFRLGLANVINTIFNPEEPFRMTKDKGKCTFCAYRKLCQR